MNFGFKRIERMNGSAGFDPIEQVALFAGEEKRLGKARVSSLHQGLPVSLGADGYRQVLAAARWANLYLMPRAANGGMDDGKGGARFVGAQSLRLRGLRGGASEKMRRRRAELISRGVTRRGQAQHVPLAKILHPASHLAIKANASRAAEVIQDRAHSRREPVANVQGNGVHRALKFPSPRRSQSAVARTAAGPGQARWW